MFDVNFFFLKKLLPHIKKYGEYKVKARPNIQLYKKASMNLFYIDKPLKSNLWVKLIPRSFLTIKNLPFNDDFSDKNAELKNRIFIAVENSDIKSFKKELEYIRALKEINTP